MDPDNEKLYYVSIRLRNDKPAYSYICNDLTVKPGDFIIVPVYPNLEFQATVIDAAFYAPENAPYPPEKTKCVIRKVAPEEFNAEIQKLITVLEAVKSALPESAGIETNAQTDKQDENNKSKHTRHNAIAEVLAVLIYAPVVTLFTGFVLLIIFFCFGWEPTDGSFRTPFLVAYPISVGICIYVIKSPSPSDSSLPKKYHKGNTKGKDYGSGWYPGCPEEKMFTSEDKHFDSDGDGHLNPSESGVKFNTFFDDDE